ncbi:uncharacterized protein IWZ02DRAFT_177764 [Phyllosticta citriasiana]|uniref:Uncharacterized protein n=1 Tax=Phyllosticta citriasiana TaxID=595635 RepID=A0ABR1KH86_9PEZI
MSVERAVGGNIQIMPVWRLETCSKRFIRVRQEGVGALCLQRRGRGKQRTGPQSELPRIERDVRWQRGCWVTVVLPVMVAVSAPIHCPPSFLVPAYNSKLLTNASGICKVAVPSREVAWVYCQGGRHHQSKQARAQNLNHICLGLGVSRTATTWL